MSIADKKFSLGPTGKWLALGAILFVCLAPGRYDQAVLGWLPGGLFGSSIDLNVEIKRGPKQEGGNFGMINITNLSTKPIEIREVRVNHRQDQGCSWKGAQKLPTGEDMIVPVIAAMIGLCGGTMSVVSVITDQGSNEYNFRW